MIPFGTSLPLAVRYFELPTPYRVEVHPSCYQQILGQFFFPTNGGRCYKHFLDKI